MDYALTAGCELECSHGTAPAALKVLPIPTRPLIDDRLVATEQDRLPFVNVGPFLECNSKVNPMVQAAISSSFGAVLTAPCVPVLLPPEWQDVNELADVDGLKVLTTASFMKCEWLGKVTVKKEKQEVVDL